MMRHKVIVKRVGIDPEKVEVEAKYRCDAKALIMDKNCLIEYENMARIDGTSRLCIMIDEEGLLKDLPLNIVMPLCRDGENYTLEEIHGDMIIMRYRYTAPTSEPLWDYELLDITESDWETISELCDTAGMQRRLWKMLHPFGTY